MDPSNASKKPVTLVVAPSGTTPSGNSGLANSKAVSPTGPSKAVKLQIVPPKTNLTPSFRAAAETKKEPKKVKSPVVSDDDEDKSDSGSESSEEEGYYVELALSCVNDEDGETAEHNVMFNFETEENYVDQGENGYEELEEMYFQDAISQNFPGWTYDGAWEEFTVHGNELPEDYDGEVININ